MEDVLEGLGSQAILSPSFFLWWNFLFHEIFHSHCLLNVYFFEKKNIKNHSHVFVNADKFPITHIKRRIKFPLRHLKSWTNPSHVFNKADKINPSRTFNEADKIPLQYYTRRLQSLMIFLQGVTLSFPSNFILQT